MVAIFTDKPNPVEIEGIDGDVQVAAYYFDAVVEIGAEYKSTYTSYPLEFGSNAQDHAYDEPTAITIKGYTGSSELSYSVNQLKYIGASALIGNINDPLLSAGAGIAASVSASFLGGSEETRPQSTLSFLKALKKGFITFTVITGLDKYEKMKIDSITTTADEGNESGLEFVVVASQLKFSGEEKKAGTSKPINSSHLPDGDPAKIQGAPVVDRGVVFLE